MFLYSEKEKKMKKLFASIVVLFLISGLGFAQEEEDDSESTVFVSDSTSFVQERNEVSQRRQAEQARQATREKFDVELKSSFPVHWTNGRHNDSFYANNLPDAYQIDKTVTVNTSIGLSLIFNLNKKVGIMLDTDFAFGSSLTGFAQPTSDYTSLTSANANLGAVIYLINNNTLRLPLGVGVHVYYFSNELWVPDLGAGGAWMNRNEIQFGPELSLALQYHFDGSLYMFSRLSAAIDIFRLHSIEWVQPTSPDPDKIYDDRSCTDFPSFNWSIKPSIGLGIKY